MISQDNFQNMVAGDGASMPGGLYSPAKNDKTSGSVCLTYTVSHTLHQSNHTMFGVASLFISKIAYNTS